LKIVYFGSDVYLGTFTYLLKTQDILALYTYHNDEDYFNEERIVKAARENGIPVSYEKPSKEEIKDYLEKDQVDLFFSAEYAYKIPIPDHEKFRGVNVHSSLLPEGRSYYPLECAMERGLKTTGVTIHKLTDDIDGGDILCQQKIIVGEKDDSIDLYLYAAAAAEYMTKEMLKDFNRVWKCGQKQTARLPYWHRPEIRLMRLNHSMTVEEALSVFRKYNQMTEVEYDAKGWYIEAMSSGNADIGTREIQIRKHKLLYGVKGGHLRLILREKPSEKG